MQQKQHNMPPLWIKPLRSSHSMDTLIWFGNRQHCLFFFAFSGIHNDNEALLITYIL